MRKPLQLQFSHKNEILVNIHFTFKKKVMIEFYFSQECQLSFQSLSLRKIKSLLTKKELITYFKNATLLKNLLQFAKFFSQTRDILPVNPRYLYISLNIIKGKTQSCYFYYFKIKKNYCIILKIYQPDKACHRLNQAETLLLHVNF